MIKFTVVNEVRILSLVFLPPPTSQRNNAILSDPSGKI